MHIQLLLWSNNRKGSDYYKLLRNLRYGVKSTPNYGQIIAKAERKISTSDYYKLLRNLRRYLR